MQKIRLHICYEGSSFSGWQRQNEGQMTIQELLEKAVSKIFNEDIVIYGSGRTDAGVHAKKQVAHFKTTADLKRYNDIIGAIQTQLPPQITINEAFLAPKIFHASKSLKKTYEYILLNSKRPNALWHKRATWYPRKVDIDFLQTCSQSLIGEFDFQSFQNTGAPVKSTVRTVYEAKWSRKDDFLKFHITGNGFLKQMIRNIIGTQLSLMETNQSPLKFQEILKSKDRRQAGRTAPPDGLYLVDVFYPLDVDKRCDVI